MQINGEKFSENPENPDNPDRYAILVSGVARGEQRAAHTTNKSQKRVITEG